MLQSYPATVDFLRARELDDLARRPPDEPEAILRGLSGLLPLLGDEFVLVWESESLPSQPVALVSFLDKSELPLIAVVCESGLLWVADAADPRKRAALLLPEVGRGGARVRGLFACHLLRPFGQWTELLIPVSPPGRAPSEVDPMVFRALVSFRGGHLQLEPAVEDASRDGGRTDLRDEWLPLPLPKCYRYLLSRSEIFSGGVDALSLEKQLAGHPSAETTLRLWGRHGCLAVEGRSELVVPATRKVLPPYPLSHPVKSGVVVPDSALAKTMRIVVAQEGRRLQGLAFGSKVQSAWHQRLRYEPVAIDCGLDDPVPDRWPDLLIALDDRHVVRFGWRGEGRLDQLWRRLVAQLGKAVGLATPLQWTTWIYDELGRVKGASAAGEGRALRQALHYLAADRARLATARGALASATRQLTRQVSEEVEADLLLPAAWRLLDALKEWEATPRGQLPDLVWAFYEKVPFSIQELFDSHLRSGSGERLRTLNPGYDELLDHAPNVVSTYRDIKDPLRDAGINLLQALEAYSTASIIPPRESFRFRHLVNLETADTSLIAAVGAHEIRLYRIHRQRGVVGLTEITAAYTDLGSLFTAQFALSLGSERGQAVLLLGSLQGELAVWDPTRSLLAGEAPDLESKHLGGTLSAAAGGWGASRGSGKALVAHNLRGSARLLQVSVVQGAGLTIESDFATDLEWIQSLQTMSQGGRPLLALGAGEELVLLAGSLQPELATVVGRFPLGAAVNVVACLPTPEGRTLVTACTREGQVFCIEIGMELRPWKRFRWIYQVPRGASGVLTRAGSEVPLGVISTQGTLTLLSPRGDLVLDYRPHDPIDAAILLRFGTETWLVVGRQSGGMTVLLANPGSDQALSKARARLRQLPREKITELPPDNEAGELGWLFKRFEDGADPCELYDSLDFEISRTHLVHLASRQPQRVQLRVGDWVERLSLRDLAEFLRRLPAGSSGEWVLHSWERLLGPRPADPPRERGLEDDGMALYELLRHSRQEGRVIPIERLRSLPGVLLESDWLSYLVAQYLVEGIGEQVRRTTGILEPMLAALGLFPLKVARAATTIAAGSDELIRVSRVLDAVVELGEVIARQGRSHEVQACLKHLASTLEPWRKQHRASLFSRLVRFIYDPALDSEDRQGAWPKLLGLLLEAKGVAETPSELQRLFFSPLANLLPSPPPGPDVRLAEEAAWLHDIRERLAILPRLMEVTEQGATSAAEEVWRPLYDRILIYTRERLLQLGRDAADRLRTEVRVHLRPLGARYSPGQRLEMELEAQPETLERASRVRIEVALDGTGGLASVGKPLVFKVDLALLEQAQETLPIVFAFEGRLAPGQSEVQARLTVLQGEGQQSVRLIHLRLPPLPARLTTSRAPFPDGLATRGQELIDELRQLKSGCHFVLLDEELGRAELLRRMEGPGVRRVDLDAALAELGPGRTYPALLTRDNFLAALRGIQVPAEAEAAPAAKGSWSADLGTGDQILVGPCDDLWGRLLDDPSLHEVLDSCLAWLSDYRARSLFFFLDSALGARLRQRRRRGMDWRRAFLIEVNGKSPSSKAIQEAARWLVGEANSLASERLGETALERLGGDLRLGLQFRQLSRGQDLTSGTLNEILSGVLQSTPALEVLSADVKSLPPEAVHLLIVSACSKTTFRFAEVSLGLLAAETISSSAPGGRKGRPVLAEGDRVDAHALTSLRSDREAKSRSLAVAGYSRRRPTSIREGIEHLALFLGTDAAVERIAARLAEIGAVELRDGVILARPPYSELIRDSVKKQASPAEVYQLLSGGPSPLGAWGLPLFNNLTAEKIQQIDARIADRQASMLQLLGHSWDALADRRSFPESQLRRALSTLTGREVEWLAGSGRNSDRLPRWEGDNRDLLFGLGERQSQRETPYHLLIFAAPEEGRPEAAPPPALLKALTTSGPASGRTGHIERDQLRHSLLLVARPGGRSAASGERRWVELSDDELRTAALNQEWEKAFWGLVRARAGLKALAPFKSMGALPPGSPVFAGRDEELRYMQEHLRQMSFLIVGSRQVGKTSLLNELRFRLAGSQNRELGWCYMDLQGVDHSDQMTGDRLEWNGDPAAVRGLKARELFIHVVDLMAKEHRFPVFLLNEIDVLLRTDSSFLRFLRGLHDASRAQFVMTGYTQAAAACHDAESPFWHWTTSPDRKRKYLILAELSRRAAEQIIEVLEKPPLELVWSSPKDKLKGQRLILDRSYCIPHLIQEICLGLVEYLDKTGKNALREDDVREVVDEVSAWRRVVNEIKPAFAAPSVQRPELAGTLVELLLYAAMKDLYFSGPRPPIKEKLLPHHEPSADASLSFSPEEVHRWLRRSLVGLLNATELAEADKLLNQVDIGSMLSALSLTLILSQNVRTGRYYFPGHLYPRELQRNLGKGELIDDHIVERVLRFAYFLPTTGLPTTSMATISREGDLV